MLRHVGRKFRHAIRRRLEISSRIHRSSVDPVPRGFGDLEIQENQGAFPKSDEIVCGSKTRGNGLWATERDGSAPVLAIQALTGTKGRLAPLSEPAIEVANLLASGNWDASQAVSHVAYDADLKAKLLAATNSATTSAVTSIDGAVSRLGAARVVALTVADSLRDSFSRGSDEYGLSESQLWRHSIASALAVERMGNYLPQAPPPECQAAALMHDLGHLVFAHTLPDDLQALLGRETNVGWANSRQIERDLVGTDHARVGGAIASHWKLAPVFVDAIEFHHAPNQIHSAHHAHVAHVVGLADMVAATIGESLGGREQNPVDEAGTMRKLSLSGEQFSRLSQEVYDDLEDVLCWYS
ncbi:MAG: HD-like signal output (HDOD) protein [Planctomycetota bacterium]|jgi:HD-like signal output (HDOD) protein